MAGLDIKGLSISIQSSLHVPVPAPHHFINNIQISDIMTTDTPSQAARADDITHEACLGKTLRARTKIFIS